MYEIVSYELDPQGLLLLARCKGMEGPIVCNALSVAERQLFEALKALRPGVQGDEVGNTAGPLSVLIFPAKPVPAPDESGEQPQCGEAPPPAPDEPGGQPAETGESGSW